MLASEVSTITSEDHKPRHLWSNDPETAKIRRILIIFWIRTSLLTWILILLVALIYLGSGVDPNRHTRSLDVFITNFDDGLAGVFFLDAFRNSPGGNQTLNWIFQQPSSRSLVQQIEDGKAWASVFMRAGTSNTLNRVLQSILDGNLSNSSYRPSSATTIIFDQGRNLNTVNGFVLPPIRAAIARASARYSAYLQSQIAQYSNATLGSVITAIALANITHTPIGSTDMDLHPAFPYASFLATTLGYLFLWLIMTSLVALGIRITQPLAGKVKIIDIIIFRLFNSLFNGFIIALIFSLSILWFASFTRAVPFIRFLLFNWLVCITFTGIIALFVINLGNLAQAALVLFLIINLATSTSNIAIELQNRFYRIGFGLPLFHCFSGGRRILFGSHTRLHVDIAVLFAYYFAAIILLLATGIYRMRKQEAQVLEKLRKKKTKTNNIVPRSNNKKM